MHFFRNFSLAVCVLALAATTFANLDYSLSVFKPAAPVVPAAPVDPTAPVVPDSEQSILMDPLTYNALAQLRAMFTFSIAEVNRVAATGDHIQYKRIFLQETVPVRSARLDCKLAIVREQLRLKSIILAFTKRYGVLSKRLNVLHSVTTKEDIDKLNNSLLMVADVSPALGFGILCTISPLPKAQANIQCYTLLRFRIPSSFRRVVATQTPPSIHPTRPITPINPAK